MICCGNRVVGSCPNCGYCPCCGRSNWHGYGWRQHWQWPQPQPVWIHQPVVVQPVPYITCNAPGSATAAIQALAG